MKSIHICLACALALLVPAIMAFVPGSSFPDFTFLDAGADGCPTPGMVGAVSVDDTSAVISWRESDSTTVITLIARNLADPDDSITVDSITSPYSLTGLTGCSRYSVELLAACGDSLSNTSQSLIIETDGCCRIPSGLRTESVSETFAEITWDEVGEAGRFLFRYREMSDDEAEWDTIITPDRMFVLAELEPCSAYEMQVKSTCGLFDTTDFSQTVLIQTPGCGPCTDAGYCEAGAIDATMVWIDSIRFANVNMPSGPNDGYFGYLTEQSALERGRTYSFYITPGYAGQTCPTFLRAWFDLDQDGTFNDSTELLLDTIDMTGEGMRGEFTLPDTLPRDITRLRFAAKPMTTVDTLPPSSCGIYDFGEVEDYCIRIDEPCPVADNLDTVSITKESALIRWDKVDNAFGYLYTYNELGEDPGELTSTGDTMVLLEDLKKCTEYIFRLVSICPQDSNGQFITFKTDCESAVEDLEPLLAEFNIYPNPFSTELNINIAATEKLTGNYQLFTSTGQLLYNEQFELFPGQQTNRRIDVDRSTPAGMYFLVIRANDRVLTRKIVKSGY